MSELLSKYQALSPREQRALWLGGGALVIALVYFLVWAPMQQSLTQTELRLLQQQELLQWVNTQTDRVKHLKAGPAKRAFSGSLTQLVNSSAKRHQISLARMQPSGDELQVWVEEADFNRVLDWLMQLESSGVQIQEADLAEAKAPGQVKIRRLVLAK